MRREPWRSDGPPPPTQKVAARCIDTPDDDVELVASMPLDAGQRLRGVIPLNENILFSYSTVINLIKYGLIYIPDVSSRS